MNLSTILFIGLFLRFINSYSLSSSRNQFRIFSLFFDYVPEVQNFGFDSSHIAFLSKKKIVSIINLSNFEVEAQFDLSHMNFTESNNKFNVSLQYPRGILSHGSLFFLFEMHDRKKKKMFSFIDNSINSIQLLQSQKSLIFTAGNETESCDFSDLFMFPDAKKTNFLNRTRLAGSPIEVIAIGIWEKDYFEESKYNKTIDNSEKFGNDGNVIEISKDNISLKNVHGENANNSNETAEFYLFLASRNKLRKIPEPELIAYIYETIEKAYDGCLLEPGFSINDLDFEMDSRFFLVSCQDQLFVFSFDSLKSGPSQQNTSINHIYYRNSIENLFFSRTSLRILHSDEKQLVYVIFSSETVCFYTFESYKEDYKYFSNRRSLCMKNSVAATKIEDVFMNDYNSFINLALRNQTDESVFFPGFHKCVLNMRTSNFVCQICNKFYCPKQCERYQYPGCNFVGEVQRTFFGILTGMVLFSIVFLCCAHVCKNRESVCELFVNIFRCFFLLIKNSIDCVKRIEYRRVCGRVQIIRSYLKYWCKCGFWKKLNEEGNNCPICLEHIDNRPKTLFACGRHEAHTDCFQHYMANNRENNKTEGCPFRDA